MECPVCGNKAGVYLTVNEEDGVRRYRKCACGYKFRTFEVIVGTIQGDGRHGGKRVRYNDKKR